MSNRSECFNLSNALVVNEAEVQVLLYLNRLFHEGPQRKDGISSAFICHKSKLGYTSHSLDLLHISVH